MTEEKAEEYILSLELEKGNKILQLKEVIKAIYKAFLNGLAEGRKGLAELEEENEKLKKENEELQELNKKLQWKVAENINLKAENEKLKQEIESWKKRAAETYWDS